MSAVTKITPHLHSLTCPDELRSLPCWLMWRYETVGAETKPRKVPYYAGGGKRSGTQGSPEDTAKLVAFDAAVNAAARNGFDGVGMATLPQNDVTIIDFDRAIVNGELIPEVERACLGSYAEYSPSGQGVHLVVRGAWPNKKNHGDKADPAQYGVETFHSKGFVTWTGNPIPATGMCGAENTIAPMNEDLRTLLTRRLLADKPPADATPARERMGFHPEQISEMLEPLDPEDGGHEQWLRIGMAIHHETDGEGFDLWDEWSADGATYPGRDELQKRWDSFGRRGTGQVTIRSLLKIARAHGVNVGVSATADEFDDLGVDPEEAEARDKKEGAEFSAKPSASKFELLQAGAFIARPAPGWIIKNLIPRADLIVLYGESGSGKTFVILDITMAIARGVPWRGLKVKAGRVVYIAAEGGGGFRNRLKAYGMQHGVDLSTLPFYVIHAAPNFLMKEDVAEVAKAIKASAGADIIVVDTFAQVTPGANENAAEDMGRALRHARMMSDATGATVIMVHHSGKDASKGARGWSGIRAAADAELEVVRDGDQRALRTTKQKDGDDSAQWGFRLEPVTIDLDEDGDIVTSCVIAEGELPQKADKRKPARVEFGPWETIVMDTYAEIALGGQPVMRPDLVITAADKVAEPESVKIRRATALRALKNLCKAGPKKRFAMVEEMVIEETN